MHIVFHIFIWCAGVMPYVVLSQGSGAKDNIGTFLYKKKDILISLILNPSGYYSKLARSGYIENAGQLRVGFMLASRTGLGLTYMGISSVNLRNGNRFGNYYNAGILDLSHILANSRTANITINGGFIYSQERAYIDSTQWYRKKPGLLTKAGIGFNVRAKKWKRLSLGMGATFVLNLNRPSTVYRQFLQVIDFGVTYRLCKV